MLAQRIRGDSLAYGASMLLVRALAFLSLVVFARILSPEQLGVYNILLIGGLAMVSVTSVELAQALMRYCAGPPGDSRDSYYATVFWFVGASSLLCALLLTTFSGPVARLLFGDSRWSTEVALYGVCVIANSIFGVLQSLCRSELRRPAFTLVTSTWAAASLVLSVSFALTQSRPLLGVIAGQAAGAIVGSAVAVAYLGVPSPRMARLKALRELLRFSVPLVISVLSILAAAYASRLLLARWGQLHEVAEFAVASQLATVAALALVGVQSALGPLVLAHHAAPDTPKQLARMFGKFWIVSMTLCLFLGIAAEPLVSAFFNPEYARSAAWVFPISLATVMSNVYVFWPGFSVSHWTKGQMMVTLASGLFGVAINLLAVRQWGVQGAVAGTLLSSAVFLLSWICASNSRYPIPISVFKMLLVSACAAGAYAFAAVTGPLPNIGLLAVAKAAVAIAAFVTISRAIIYGSWRILGQGTLQEEL